jgi:signal peptidase I
MLPSMMPRPTIRRWRGSRELLDFLVFIAAIYAFVNLATVRFIVQGPSMEPTFYNDQFLIVSRANYLLAEPQFGDIVVFHYPGNTEEDYIKRMIGLPGDRVEFRQQQLYINGEFVPEPYINEPCRPLNCPDRSWQLGEDEYFLMGDNRNRSSDSRVFRDVVRREHIVGEVLIRYWPPSDWGFIHQARLNGD